MAYEPKPEEKSMSMLSFVLVILTGWVGPLILFLMKKDEGPFVKLHTKQTLVFGIVYVVCWVIPFVGWFVLGPIASLANLIFGILGAIKVNKGEKFLYPVVANMFCKAEIAAVYGEGGAASAPPAGPTPPAPGA